MWLTPPVTGNDEYAQKMIISDVMNFDDVRKWDDTNKGRRGEERSIIRYAENRGEDAELRGDKNFEIN